MDRVKGKVALVTGSASGIGKATVTLLAKEGAKVIVSDINVSGGREAANQIKKDGGQAIFIKLDVTKERDWSNAITKIVDKYGRLDVLVNNAGVCISRSIENSTMVDYNYIFSVDIAGVFLGVKYAFGTMKKTGGGSIVNISSGAGIKATKDSSLYCAAKGAVRLFTKSAAIEGGKIGYDLNIRVNSIHPGVVETPLKWSLDKCFGDKAENQAKLDAMIPIGHTAQPIDIANAVLFLASDESSYATGAEFCIDGGWIL